MTIRVTRNLTAGGKGLVTATTRGYKEIVHVTGLTNNKAPLYQAEFAVDGVNSAIKVPRIGEMNPYVPDVYVQAINPRHFNNSWRQAEIEVTWASATRPAASVIALMIDVLIDGISIFEPKNTDAFGRQKFVYYGGLYTTPVSQGSPSAGTKVVRAGGSDNVRNDYFQKDLAVLYNNILGDDFRAGTSTGTGSEDIKNVLREPLANSVNIFCPTIEFVTVEIGCPFDKISKIVNTVNKTKFQSKDPGTWLCRKCSAVTKIPYTARVTRRLSWQVRYLFQWRELGWRTCGIFKNSRTNTVPQDAPPPSTKGKPTIKTNLLDYVMDDGSKLEGYEVGPNGAGIFQDYAPVNWNGLKLPDVTKW